MYNVELYNADCRMVSCCATSNTKVVQYCRELMLLSMTIRWVPGPAAGDSSVLPLNTAVSLLIFLLKLKMLIISTKPENYDVELVAVEDSRVFNM